MGREIKKRIVECSVAILLAIALLDTSFAKEHVNPNCCDYAASPSGIKIQFLLEACAVTGETARGMIPFFDCQSYVLGVIDSYRQVKSSVPSSNKICIPDDLKTKDVLELIWKKYPNWDIPESRQASEVILEVLKERYPCEK